MKYIKLQMATENIRRSGKDLNVSSTALDKGYRVLTKERLERQN